MRRIHLVVSDELLSQIATIAQYERRDARQQALHLLEQAVARAMDEIRFDGAMPVAPMPHNRNGTQAQLDVVVYP